MTGKNNFIRHSFYHTILHLLHVFSIFNNIIASFKPDVIKYSMIKSLTRVASYYHAVTANLLPTPTPPFTNSYPTAILLPTSIAMTTKWCSAIRGQPSSSMQYGVPPVWCPRNQAHQITTVTVNEAQQHRGLLYAYWVLMNWKQLLQEYTTIWYRQHHKGIMIMCNNRNGRIY